MKTQFSRTNRKPSATFGAPARGRGWRRAAGCFIGSLLSALAALAGDTNIYAVYSHCSDSTDTRSQAVFCGDFWGKLGSPPGGYMSMSLVGYAFSAHDPERNLSTQQNWVWDFKVEGNGNVPLEFLSEGIGKGWYSLEVNGGYLHGGSAPLSQTNRQSFAPGTYSMRLTMGLSCHVTADHPEDSAQLVVDPIVRLDASVSNSVNGAVYLDSDPTDTVHTWVPFSEELRRANYAAMLDRVLGFRGERTGTNLVLSWADSFANARLEASPALGAPWTEVTLPRTNVNTRLKVAVPMETDQGVFRLRIP